MTAAYSIAFPELTSNKNKCNEIKCTSCGAPSGVMNPFSVRVPPGGLKCAKCGNIIIRSIATKKKDT